MKPASSGRAFAVTAATVVSKTGVEADCEDVIADGEHYSVLADGATDVSGRDFDGRSAGRTAAELVCKVVSGAPEGISAEDLVELVNEEYRRVLGRHTRNLDVAGYPTASFCAIEKRTGRVIRVGDTSWRTHRRTFEGRKLIDEARAHTRAALLRCLLIEGVSESELLLSDPGWEMNLPVLEHQATCRNTLEAGEYSYGAIDGTPVPPRLVEEWQLSLGERAVVMASDGYPALLMTAEACEAYLAEDLAADPLRIGRHRSTKGIRPPNLSYDDRSFIRLDEQSSR